MSFILDLLVFFFFVGLLFGIIIGAAAATTTTTAATAGPAATIGPKMPELNFDVFKVDFSNFEVPFSAAEAKNIPPSVAAALATPTTAFIVYHHGMFL